MPQPFDDALSGRPWSVASLLYGLSDYQDDEGRPIGERRAAILHRRDVPMQMKVCPYHDEREGGLMNVSALAQIMRHLEDVAKDAADFRASVSDEGDDGYDGMLLTVLDLLSAPARHALRTRDASNVPARAAVSHKLAAGYFGAVLGIRERDGATPTVDAFMDHVHLARGLIGASEVCAGPIGRIKELSALLLDGVEGHPGRVVPSRIAFARALAAQIELGMEWRRFDEAAERVLVRRFLATRQLHPRTLLVRRKIEELVERDTGTPLPHFEAPATALAKRLEQLVEHGDGALTPTETCDANAFYAIASQILVRYHDVIRRHQHLESDMRALFDFDPAVPLDPRGMLIPRRRALDLVETVLGHRVRTPGETQGFVLGNHHRAVELTVAPTA